MRQNDKPGVIAGGNYYKESFIQSIANKEKVFIGTTHQLTLTVIHYCAQNPDLNLYISQNLFMTSDTAFAFRIGFDQNIINKINRL
jgi:hypothetical protein